MSWRDDNAAWLARAERWKPTRSEPFRVRVWLSGPVVWDDQSPLTLDGALQFAVVLRETGHLPDDVFSEVDRDGVTPIPIPVDDVGIDGLPIACASWGLPPPIAVLGVRWRRKRARAEAFSAARIQVAGGWAKSLNIPIGVLHTPWLDFYLRGDPDKTVDLLREIGGLGRDSTRGLGTVLGYEVAPDPDDRSLLYQDVPQRALPLVMDGGLSDPRTLAPGGYEERMMRTRAPYWATRDSERICVCPSLRIVRGDLPLPSLDRAA